MMCVPVRLTNQPTHSPGSALVPFPTAQETDQNVHHSHTHTHPHTLARARSLTHVVLVGQSHNLLEWGHGPVHGEDTVGDDEPCACRVGLAQAALQIAQVAVLLGE
jgi:hypothetical protein